MKPDEDNLKQASEAPLSPDGLDQTSDTELSDGDLSRVSGGRTPKVKRQPTRRPSD